MTYIDERRRQRSVVWSKERNQKDQASNQKKYRSHHRPKASDGGDDKSKRGEDKKNPADEVDLFVAHGYSQCPSGGACQINGLFCEYNVAVIARMRGGCRPRAVGFVTGGGAKDQALCVEIHCFCCEDIVLVSVA